MQQQPETVCSTEEKKVILYSLGLNHRDVDPEKSLEYFNQLSILAPEHQGDVKEKIGVYLSLGRVKEALDEAQKLHDKELAALMTITVLFQTSHQTRYQQILQENNFDNLDPETFSRSDKLTHHRLYNNIMSTIHITEGNFEKALNVYINEKTPNPDRILSNLAVILQISQENGLWSEGMEAINSFYSKYPDILQNHNNHTLKYEEFIFYERNGLTEKAAENLEFLTKFADSNEYIHRLVESMHFILGTAALEKMDLEQADHHFSNCAGYAKYKLLLDKLKILVSLSSAGAADQNPENESDQAENVASIDWIDSNNETNETEDYADVDPKAIHAYFQAKKQTLLRQKADKSSSQFCSWNIDKKSYTSSQEDIIKIEGKSDFYAVIDKKLLGTLDNALLTQFIAALNKGVTSKSHHSVGIKFIAHKLIELKINGDERLYTSEIYKNKNGKYLIVFSKSGTHADVARVAQKSKLKIIETGISYNLPEETANLAEEKDYPGDHHDGVVLADLSGEVDNFDVDTH